MLIQGDSSTDGRLRLSRLPPTISLADFSPWVSFMLLPLSTFGSAGVRGPRLTPLSERVFRFLGIWDLVDLGFLGLILDCSLCLYFLGGGDPATSLILAVLGSI